MVDNVPEMYLRSVSGKENFTTESREKERMTGNITVLQCDRKKRSLSLIHENRTTKTARQNIKRNKNLQ